jgi:LPS export ABC transporter protein LptC
VRTSAKTGLAAGLAALVGLAACQDGRTTPVASEFMEGIEAPVVFGMTSFITVDGVREGRVQADTAFTYPESSKIDLRRMTVWFYDEEGRERATVQGRTGEWQQETNYMVARGDVVLRVHTDGSRLESAEIHYDPDSERIWSDSATVRTLADGSVTRGSAFESDIEFENVRVLNVRGDAPRVF